jgi:hypothetical protein
VAETVVCRECRKKLLVPDDLVGSQVRCPSCGTTFVADPSAPEPAPEAIRTIEERPPRLDEHELPERPRSRREDEDYSRRPWRRDYEPHRAGLILALGIIGLVACALTAPFAWALGSQDLAAMRAGRMDPEGEGMTRAGQVCGIIGTLFLALQLLVALLLVLPNLLNGGF